MKLFQITIPLKDNAGNALDPSHFDFCEAMLGLAGGYTRLPTTMGAWQSDNGKVFYDDAVPYQVACEPGTWPKVLQRAFDLFPDQLAIFHCELGEATIAERPVSAAPRSILSLALEAH